MLTLGECETVTLDDYLKSSNETERAFADRIEAKQQEVNRYRRGLRMPGPDRMAAIMRATDGRVTANDFYGLAPTEPAEEEGAAA